MGAALIVAVVLALQAGQGEAPPEPTLPVSVERIRDALAKPASSLTLPRRRPDFVVDITERQRFERMIAPFLQFDAGVVKKPLFFSAQPKVGTTPALASIDLMPLASAIGRQLSGARRDRAAGSARGDVLRAIAEYCAAQPNGGTAIRICMDPSSIR